MSEEVVEIQKQWAEVNYMPDGDAKEKAFEKLSNVATQIRLNHPQDAESWIWEGIVYSSYAGAKGGIGALSLAKKAKAAYEEAIQIDGSALNGSAYTSLGILYSKVPGWPIGFGSDKKAMKLLKQGLKYNPEGIDSNYFYAEFLYEEEDYLTAKNHLQKAKSAEPRTDRPKADEGRHREIEQLLVKVNEELAD
ncbi:hypothetical protein QNI24_12660 [Marinicella sp. X102]|nr:hypothetical protein [Marinicella marina]